MTTAAADRPDLLANIVNRASEGIAVFDARQQDFPFVWVNAGFENLTGYAPAEVIGQPHVLLQGADSGQPETAILFASLTRGEGCHVTLRNYRKDGSMFWGNLNVAPIHDPQGTLTHFLAILMEESIRSHVEQQAPAPDHTDPLIGICNRSHFDQRFADLLTTAKRTFSGISVLIADLDHFKQFNERYGHAAGDECLRMVGECIAKSFNRASDCVARYGGEEFAIVSFSNGIEPLRHHAQKLCEQVRALGIPHSDSSHGVVTISIGGVHRLPDQATTEDSLIERANQQLLAAKHGGRDRIHVTDQL